MMWASVKRVFFIEISSVILLRKLYFHISLILLRHKGRVDLVQHGHRIKRRISVTVSVLRSVAIDVEVCRSGRIGGVAGSRTAGNCRFFAVFGRGTS